MGSLSANLPATDANLATIRDKLPANPATSDQQALQLMQLALQAGKLDTVVTRLDAVATKLASTLVTQGRDQNGALVQYDASAPTLLARADGTPVDGFSTIGSGSAVNDVLWSVDTTYAKSVTFDYTAVGAGAQTVLEGTVDGASWKPIVAYVLDLVAAPVSGAVGPNARHYGANTLSYIAVRLRLASASTSGAVTSIARTSTLLLPTAHTVPRLQVARLGTAAASASGSTRNTAVMVLEAENTTAAKRYLQVANGATYASGSSVWTMTLLPNSARSIVFPGGGLPVTGFSLAATTDFFGATLAAAGDVVATAGYSA